MGSFYTPNLQFSKTKAKNFDEQNSQGCKLELQNLITPRAGQNGNLDQKIKPH